MKSLKLSKSMTQFMSSGVIRRVVGACVRRERFIKPHKHRGPKTGKDDRAGAYWRTDKRTTSRYGYLSEDGSMFIEDPLMVPQYIVPNLTSCQLKPYVSASIPVEDVPPATPSDYLDAMTVHTGSFK